MSENGRLQAARRWIVSPEAVALSGVACAVQLSVSSVLLSRQPGVHASEAGRLAWYGDAGNRDSVLLAVQLAPVGAISFLWFMAVIRSRLGRGDHRQHDESQPASRVAVVMFVAGGFSGPLDFLFPAWLVLVSVTVLVNHRTRAGDAAQRLL